MVENFANSFFVNRYLEEIVGIESAVMDLKNNTLKFRDRISELVAAFTPTVDFATQLFNFQQNANKFIIDLEDKDPDSGANVIITQIQDSIVNCSYIKQDERFLSTLNIPTNPTLDQIRRLDFLTRKFIDQFAADMLSSVLYNICKEFSIPEFCIASHYTAIFTNGVGIEIQSLMQRLAIAIGALRDCLDVTTGALNLANGAEGHINSILAEIGLTNTGVLDYSALSSLSLASQENIQDAVASVKVVVQNSMTSLARIVGENRENITFTIENLFV